MSLFVTLLSAFLVGFFASTAATGPVMMLAFKNALEGALRRSIAIVLGSAVMETLYCGLAAVSVSGLMQLSDPVERFSRWASVGVFAVVGVYLLLTEIRAVRRGEPQPKLKFATRAFLTGITLVAVNPSIILTWSAATMALTSFSVIKIPGIGRAVLFALSAGVGTICGSLALIAVTARYRERLSISVMHWIIRIIGVGLIVLAAVYLIRLLASYGPGA